MKTTPPTLFASVWGVKWNKLRWENKLSIKLQIERKVQIVKQSHMGYTKHPDAQA